MCRPRSEDPQWCLQKFILLICHSSLHSCTLYSLIFLPQGGSVYTLSVKYIFNQTKVSQLNEYPSPHCIFQYMFPVLLILPATQPLFCVPQQISHILHLKLPYFMHTMPYYTSAHTQAWDESGNEAGMSYYANTLILCRIT